MATSLTRYYRVLGLPASASAKEIKSAYIDLCKRCHPDILQTSDPKEEENNKLKFQEIQEAYSQLINKDGSKNTEFDGSNYPHNSRGRRSRDEWARQAGFPGQYETFRERSFYYENPYMNRQYKKPNNSESSFNFEEYYRKKYGQDYDDYRKWSSDRKAGTTEDYFSQAREDFWRQRRWDEFRGYQRSGYGQGSPKERIAAMCVLAFLTSNLIFYILAVPSDSSRRPKTHWGQL